MLRRLHYAILALAPVGVLLVGCASATRGGRGLGVPGHSGPDQSVTERRGPPVPAREDLNAHAGRDTPDQRPREGDPYARIELLGFPACPLTPRLRANLSRALGGAAFTEVDQELLPSGDPRRGWPAPTILVDGRDLFGLHAPASAEMGCRIYEGGVPTADEIAARLRGR